MTACQLTDTSMPKNGEEPWSKGSVETSRVRILAPDFLELEITFSSVEFPLFSRQFEHPLRDHLRRNGLRLRQISRQHFAKFGNVESVAFGVDARRGDVFQDVDDVGENDVVDFSEK